MKIYIDRAPVIGPWGGGNKTVTKLTSRLKHLGIEVVHTLDDDQVDIIFCFDPRPNKFGLWYQHYLNYKNQHGCKIIQRVGDLGTHGKPELTELVRMTIPHSDFLIFPSEWAREHIGYSGDNFKIVHNAPISDFYKSRTNNPLSKKIKIVTHHWSTNPKKGFDIYALIDYIIGENDDLSFTYIGRLPEGFKFHNSTYVEATGDNEMLAKLISECHIYLTASEEEAGANHVLEALACGLPIAYHSKGGSIVEYCRDYGLSYDDRSNLLATIRKISDRYSLYKKKAMEYNDNIDRSVDRYLEIIEENF
jgi:glycosyltransferase involved in cell wall biosynthesis